MTHLSVGAGGKRVTWQVRVQALINILAAARAQEEVATTVGALAALGLCASVDTKGKTNNRGSTSNRQGCLGPI